MKRLLVFCLAMLLSLPSCLAEKASETRLTTFLNALMSGEEMALPEGTQRDAMLAQIAELRAVAERIPQIDEVEAQQTELCGASAFYFREMAQHPAPAEILRALEKPTLLINGERDFQVTVSEGREQWAQALDLSAPWLRCLWADVNHALMRPEAPEGVAGTAAEYYIESTVDAEVIEAIAAFIHQTEEKHE